MKHLLLMCVGFLAIAGNCHDDANKASPPISPPPGFEVSEEAQKECDAQGGKMITGGLSPHPICQTTTPDADKACASNDDCSGFCLAETKTCTPTSPYFGCFEVLPSAENPATLCVD